MSTDSTAHDEKISQFCSVTGANEEEARKLLEFCDWQLEFAIETHLEGSTSKPSASTSSFGNDSDSIRPPIPPVRQVLVQHPTSYAPDLPQRRYNTRTGASSDVYDPFRDFRVETQWQENLARDEDGAIPSCSADILSNNRRTLNELFAPPMDLMYRGTFGSTRETGTIQNKWILVDVQNSREFDCQTLNRDVWSNSKIKDIVKENFLFWQVAHDTNEGAKFKQFYKVRSFPYVSIIDPRTGQEMKSWPGKIELKSFCDSVIEFLTDHPSPDGSEDANKMKKLRVIGETKTLCDLTEEAQLEAAIKASLQESEGTKRVMKDYDDDDDDDDIIATDDDDCEILSDDRKRPATAEQKAPVTISDEDEEVVEMKKNNQSKTLEDPMDEFDIDKVDPSQLTCRIALRYPDGSSSVQKFSPQMRLASVRSYVRKNKQDAGYAHHIEFVAPPNKKLTESMMKETLEDLGLTPASRLEVIYGSAH